MEPRLAFLLDPDILQHLLQEMQTCLSCKLTPDKTSVFIGRKSRHVTAFLKQPEMSSKRCKPGCNLLLPEQKKKPITFNYTAGRPYFMTSLLQELKLIIMIKGRLRRFQIQKSC